jgi:hypothetical protein
LAVRLTNAKAAAPDVVVEKLVPAVFSIVPVKAFSSVLVEPVAGTNQSLDPF